MRRCQAKWSVSIQVIEGLVNIGPYSPRLTLYVLNDQPDIGAHIEQLKEESKVILEPLIRRYMLTAEALTCLTSHKHSLEIQGEQSRLLSIFSSVKEDIDSHLEDYRQRIDRLIEQNTVRCVCGDACRPGSHCLT